MPDRFKTLNDSDDLFAKVPHTNAAMRNSLKACNTLQCLALFKDSNDNLKIPVDYNLHLSILKIICDEGVTNWNELYSSNVLRRLRNLSFSKETYLHCFKHLESFKRFYNAFLFHVECTINDGVCMIHEGSKILGRGPKSSLLVWEISCNREAQYNIAKGEHWLNQMFGSQKLIRSKSRTLNMHEYRNMYENLEHDQIMCANHDRQSVAFFDKFVDDG